MDRPRELRNFDKRRILITCAILIITFSGLGCDKSTEPPSDSNPSSARTFQSSFESTLDFSGFYITPQNTTNSNHDLSSEVVHSGGLSHKGWILGPNPESTASINNNHRAYPTVQLYKTTGGAFKTPALIELWVWLDLQIQPGQWFSFATLDHTTSETWDGVLVNLSDQGFVHLMHVPYNTQAIYKYQTTSLTFPMRTWVKLTIEIHFDTTDGYAKVWQNDTLVSWAEVKRGSGLLTQAHFGLYAPPSMTEGLIFNDDLLIKELTTKSP